MLTVSNSYTPGFSWSDSLLAGDAVFSAGPNITTMEKGMEFPEMSDIDSG